MSIELISQLKNQNEILQKKNFKLKKANYLKWLILIAGSGLGLASLALSIISLVNEQSAISWTGFAVSTTSIGLSSIGIFSECFNISFPRKCHFPGICHRESAPSPV